MTDHAQHDKWCQAVDDIRKRIEQLESHEGRTALIWCLAESILEDGEEQGIHVATAIKALGDAVLRMMCGDDDDAADDHEAFRKMLKH